MRSEWHLFCFFFFYGAVKGRYLEQRERNSRLPIGRFLSALLRKNHRKHAVENLFHRPQRTACQIISSLEWFPATVSRFYMIIANTAGSLWQIVKRSIRWANRLHLTGPSADCQRPELSTWSDGETKHENVQHDDAINTLLNDLQSRKNDSLLLPSAGLMRL